MCGAALIRPEMMMTAEKPSTREAILDAAQAVVSSQGGARLTIDAVVTESGFSKGGVLYHFPSKTALLQAMLGRMIDRIAAEIDAAETRARDAGEPVALAMITAMLTYRKTDPELSVAILAASAEQPELLDPARKYVKDMITRALNDAPDPTLARIVSLAIDGLHFNELLGIDYVSDDQRDAIQSRLIRMMQEMYS